MHADDLGGLDRRQVRGVARGTRRPSARPARRPRARRRRPPSSRIRRVSTVASLSFDADGSIARRPARVAELNGFMQPRSPEGRASLVPDPPWHYSGEMLTIEYRADPGRSPRCCPTRSSRPTRTRTPSRSSGPTGSRAPTRSRSCSTPCGRSTWRLRRGPVSVPGRDVLEEPYIWVDRDYALARGWHQGYPKKLADLHDPAGPVGRAGPRLQPGAVFGATLASTAAGWRRRFTVTGESDTNGFVNASPMLHPGTSLDRAGPAALDRRARHDEELRLGGLGRLDG